MIKKIKFVIQNLLFFIQYQDLFGHIKKALARYDVVSVSRDNGSKQRMFLKPVGTSGHDPIMVMYMLDPKNPAGAGDLLKLMIEVPYV